MKLKRKPKRHKPGKGPIIIDKDGVWRTQDGKPVTM